jgi:hypothetical protein
MEWAKNQGVHPKASKSELKADRPDRSKYFNYTNDRDQTEFCCTALGGKSLTSLGVADMYTFLMNTQISILGIYQQLVYKHTVPTVKYQIQTRENPTPAEVISMDAARVDNAILLDNLTTEVGHEEPEIRCTVPYSQMDTNCTHDRLHFGMPGSCNDYDDEGNVIDESNAIPTASWPQWAAMKLNRFDLGTSDVNGYDGHDRNDVDADEVGEATQLNNGSMQTL